MLGGGRNGHDWARRGPQEQARETGGGRVVGLWRSSCGDDDQPATPPAGDLGHDVGSTGRRAGVRLELGRDPLLAEGCDERVKLGRRLADLHDDDVCRVAAGRLPDDREGAVCHGAVEGQDHASHHVPR